MDGCAGVLVVPIIVAVIAALVAFSRAQTRSRVEMLADLARQWNGHVVQEGWLVGLKLELRVDDIPGEVTFHSGGSNSPAWTKVSFNWGTRRRLRVAPEGFSTWLRRTFGSDDFQVGDRAFDATFWIESSDAAWTRDVLSQPVRRALLTLRDESFWRGTPDVTFDVGPAGVTLKLSRWLLDDREALQRLIEIAILIFKRCREGGKTTGVVLAAVEIQKGSECPVCGTAVEQGTRCPQCATPHHDDCWKYSGGCAMFGCAGRPRRPRAAA